MKCMLCGNKTNIFLTKKVYGKDVNVCYGCDEYIDIMRVNHPRRYRSIKDFLRGDKHEEDRNS